MSRFRTASLAVVTDDVVLLKGNATPGTVTAPAHPHPAARAHTLDDVARAAAGVAALDLDGIDRALHAGGFTAFAAGRGDLDTRAGVTAYVAALDMIAAARALRDATARWRAGAGARAEIRGVAR